MYKEPSSMVSVFDSKGTVNCSVGSQKTSEVLSPLDA